MTSSFSARVALMLGLAGGFFGAGCNSLLGIEESKIRLREPASPNNGGRDGSVDCADGKCESGRDSGTTDEEGGTEDDASEPACVESSLRCEGRAQTERSVCEGSAWTSATSCELGQLCDFGSAACLPTVAGCSGRLPGHTSCIGRLRTTCGDDLVTSKTEACATVEQCTDAPTGASCIPCLKGQYRCNGNDLEVCLPDQSGFTFSAKCKVGECRANLGACSDRTCAANQYTCDGNVLRHCNAQGTAFLTETDCLDGICDAKNAQCDVCAPNQRFCNSGTARSVCSTDGQQLATAECKDAESAATPRCTGEGQCVGCVVNETMCENQREIRTCTAAGTWSEPARCNNQTCAGKTCRGECSPGQSRCNANMLEQCEPDGEWGGAQTCGGICQEDTDTSARCVLCEKGLYQCSGNDLLACSVDQTEFTKVNTCAAGLCDAPNKGCKNQVCNPREVSCRANVLSTCNADGTDFASEVSCGAGTCDADGNGGAGQCDVCAPSAILACETDGRSQRVCETDGQGSSPRACPNTASYCVRGGTCVECLSGDTMCVDNAHQRTCLGNDRWGSNTKCVNTTCIGKVCTANCAQGQGRCANNLTLLQTCQPTGFYNAGEPCSVQCKQEADTARCVACTVGQRKCNGNIPQVCNATQTGFDNGTACEPGLCDTSTGMCKPKVCTANQVTCSGTTLRRCSADGTAFTDTSCAVICDAAGNQCDICAPNSGRACTNASTRSVCNSTGQAYQDIACAAGTPLCTGNSVCIACTVGQRKCSGDIPQVCNATQTGFDNGTACEPGLCNTATGLCKTRVCTANQVTCVNNAIRRCNADGTSFTDTACGSNSCDAAGNQCDVCVANSARACTNSSTRSVCNSTGQAYQDIACAAGTPLCTGNSVCIACTVGQRKCSGDIPQVCNATQTGFDNGTACDPGLCDTTTGLCKTRVCTARQVTCVNNALRRCNADGTAFTDSPCGNLICDAAGDQCDVCTANVSVRACTNSTTRNVCNSTGQDYQNVTCPAATPLCTGNSVCIANTPFTVGRATTAGSQAFLGNDGNSLATPVRVSEDVTLLQLGLLVAAASPVQASGVLALYEDTAGPLGSRVPGRLKAYTNSFATLSSGLQSARSLDGSAVRLTAGTQYWAVLKIDILPGGPPSVPLYAFSSASTPACYVAEEVPWDEGLGNGRPGNNYPTGNMVTYEIHEFGIYLSVQR